MEGCTSIVEARGWCTLHYNRWRKSGDPNKGRFEYGDTPCSVDGCSRPAHKRGWCNRHYLRWRKTGAPEGSNRNPVPLICSIPGCGREERTIRGMCDRCYERARRNGLPNIKKSYPRPLPERFWASVNKDGPIVRAELGACWVRSGSMDPFGYTSFGTGRKSESAHRVVWKLTTDEDPGELDVLHKCDNRACVRPSHLFIGTHTDNMRDMMLKGRSGTAKLTPDLVRQLRVDHASGSTYKELIAKYKVGYSGVYAVVKRRTWAYVE